MKIHFDMKAYRIDHRTYNEGDIIPPQQKYQNELDENKINVEKVLEKNRPENKPSRDSILMLFQKFDDAKKHWTIQRNSTFYRTCIEKEEILHIGDYMKVEEIFSSISNAYKSNELAIEYWNSKLTENPIIEIFVNKAIIDKVISNSDEERKNAYAIRGGHQPIPNIRIIQEE